MKTAGFLVAALAFAACFALPVPGAVAADDALTVENALVRPTIGPVRRSAGYFTLHNAGGADRITGAEVSGAGRVELHTHLMEEGVMKMRQVEGVDVPAEGEVVFKPHGLHLMLFDLDGPLEEGASVEGVLTLEKAGRLPVTFTVGQPDMPKADDAKENGHGGEGGHHEGHH
ncbi:copper chaperone PCu(A)C [Tepidicaulis sp. LMO-SS28]|uniref:copper chaperone PCu(A)C n=1 Tax=Tepidicaulis sp. LMO-SS28 TaxID=3447455 RepID=UPI003EE10605